MFGIAEHVGVQLGSCTQRLYIRCVAQQVRHAVEPSEQGLVIAPGNFLLQRAVQIQTDAPEHQQADQCEGQRKAQAE